MVDTAAVVHDVPKMLLQMEQMREQLSTAQLMVSRASGLSCGLVVISPHLPPQVRQLRSELAQRDLEHEARAARARSARRASTPTDEAAELEIEARSHPHAPRPAPRPAAPRRAPRPPPVW